LEDSIWYSQEREWNATEKLVVAYQAVSGLADLHNVDGEGKASIAHTDIVPSQFVFVNSKGRFLLNDFNRCRFIRWNKKENKPCPFHVGSNPGTVSAEKWHCRSHGTIPFYHSLTMHTCVIVSVSGRIRIRTRDGKD
jgi:hypothetical protein